MHKHAAKTNRYDRNNALLVLPMLVVERPEKSDPIALQEFEAAQYQKERALKHLVAAANGANKAMRDARYNYANTALEEATEQAYAKLVMVTLYTQASADEWSLPTMWTDGFVDEEGYVTVYNDGRTDFAEAWQGEEVEFIRVDEHGIGMRMIKD